MRTENAPLDIFGVKVFQGFVDPDKQRALVEDLREIITRAPFFTPLTAFGKKMSVRMTSAGRYGWFSDSKGYRYFPTHPSGQTWPAIPRSITDIWHAVGDRRRMPDCCLINY